jgi:hypothetical protein
MGGGGGGGGAGWLGGADHVRAAKPVKVPLGRDRLRIERDKF